MTNNTNRRSSSPTTCHDCHRKLTSANSTIADDLCDDCYELAGLEAAHQDGDHDTEANVDCLMCDPNARADRSKATVTVRTKGLPHINHSACYEAGAHDKNREGRELCRTEGRYLQFVTNV